MVQCFHCVFLTYPEAVDIVQCAVIGLSDYGIEESQSGDFTSFLERGVVIPVLHHPFGSGFPHYANTVGVGDQNWAVEKAGVINPMCAGELAVSVKIKSPRKYSAALVPAR